MDITIRSATVNDAKRIHTAVNGYAAEGLMLPRSISAIYDSIPFYFIAECGGAFAGCAALQVIWEDLAEIRSLAVLKDFTGRGAGTTLTRTCLDYAKELAVKRIFVLTYIPEFFKKLGFVDVSKDTLPHKVWAACVNCPKFPECGEVPLIKALEG